MSTIYTTDFNYGMARIPTIRKNATAIFTKHPPQNHKPHVDIVSNVLLSSIGHSHRSKQFPRKLQKTPSKSELNKKLGRLLRKMGGRVDDDTNRNVLVASASDGKDNQPHAVEPGQLDSIKSLWQLYCNNSTIHGLRYLTSNQMLWYERFIWIAVITLATIGIIYVSFNVQIKFATNRLATVVESTVFPIYEIPFPAVTVCNYNRINWLRVPAAIDFFLPNGTTDSVDKLTRLLYGMNTFEFGSFDSFERLTQESLADISHINLTELYQQVNHRCDELFEQRCWWRNKFVDCCSIFFEQKSEYGICYAFNSATNPTGQQRTKHENNYPWRTSNYGDWSGLRVAIRLTESTRMPGLKTPSGVLVNVNHPSQWPNSAHFVPTGTQTSIVIKPTISYVMGDVHFLDVEDRQCLFQEEITLLGYETLPGLRYLRPNCISACRQKHMLDICNCTLDFIFPSASLRQCDIAAFKCLVQYDDIFNYEIPPKGNQFFGDDEVGMMCNCMSECELIEYGTEISPIPKQNGRILIGDDDDISEISVDVHFQQATMVQYRTSLVFDWMDLLVSFGGIAGLFMGCSLLSFVEATLYAIMGLLICIKKHFPPQRQDNKQNTKLRCWLKPDPIPTLSLHLNEVPLDIKNNSTKTV